MMKRLQLLIVFLIAAFVLQAQDRSIPSGYYNGTDNLTGTALRSKLHTIITSGDSHTSYSGLWTAYGSTDKKPGTNYIWDIYSDVPGGTPPYQYIYQTNQCGSYSGEGNCYNREHLWAQSWTNNDGTEKTDLHHVFPTDGKVNGMRSDYAFGKVGTATWTSQNGSKLGSCATSGFNGTVFEPRDEFKGDIARALMYVSVRYYGLDSGWKNSDMTTQSDIKDWAITMLLQWHENDPVSEKEINRNEAVYQIQGNRNPFIDHPEFAERIWSTGTTYQITASVSPSNAGTVTGAGAYGSGQTCTLTATPNSGYAFVNWTKSGTVVSTNATYSFNVSANATYQANFVTNNYPLLALSADPTSGGTVLFEKTTTIDFSAQGYTNEQNMNGADISIDNNVSVTFNAGTGNAPKYFDVGKSIRVYSYNNFVVSVPDGISITSIALTFGSGEGNNTITTNVAAFNGSTWSGSAQSVTFNIGYLQSNHRRIQKIQVKYSAQSASLDNNSSVTLKATPNSGYSFINWTKNDQIVSTNPTYNVTVTASSNYVANFMNNNVTANITVPSLTLAQNATVTINSGATLKVTGTVTKSSGATIVINDGGQFVNSTSNITGKVKKNVTKWTTTPTTDGWHAISTPVSNVTFTNVTNLTSSTYNVYRLNETNLTWENSQNTANSFSSFANGRGYLYRKNDATAVEFNGNLNVANATYTLTYTSAETKGFHLIGNPYPHEIYKGTGTAIPNTYLEDGFYTLTSAGAWVAGTDNSTPIEPCQAILVQAKNTVTSNTLTITKTTASGTSKDYDDNIMFVVSNRDYHDVAYAVFKEGHGLNKIDHRNEDIQKLCIEHNGEDFAIAEIGEGASTFNLKFHAATTGMYTMKVNVDGDFSCLHLIDRITGEDVDLLMDNEYTFVGSPTDYDNRFIVRYTCSSVSDADNEVFAYQSGNEIVIEGNGELQIFDVMGRVVTTQYLDGSGTWRAESVPTGVYILRLIGEDVKTQKIVVK